MRGLNYRDAWPRLSCRKQRFVKRCESVDLTEFDKYTAHKVVEVEQGKEGIAACYFAVMGGKVADFSDPMDSAYQFGICDKVGEYVGGSELKKRGTFSGLNALHLINGCDKPFECLASVDGCRIGFGILPLLAEVTKLMQRFETGNIFKVVEVKHSHKVSLLFRILSN